MSLRYESMKTFFIEDLHFVRHTLFMFILIKVLIVNNDIKVFIVSPVIVKSKILCLF